MTVTFVMGVGGGHSPCQGGSHQKASADAWHGFRMVTVDGAGRALKWVSNQGCNLGSATHLLCVSSGKPPDLMSLGLICRMQ